MRHQGWESLPNSDPDSLVGLSVHLLKQDTSDFNSLKKIQGEVALIFDRLSSYVYFFLIFRTCHSKLCFYLKLP